MVSSTLTQVTQAALAKHLSYSDRASLISNISAGLNVSAKNFMFSQSLVDC